LPGGRPGIESEKKLKIKNEKLKIKNGSCALRALIKRLRRKKRLYAGGVLNPVRRTPLPFLIFHFAFFIFNLSVKHFWRQASYSNGSWKKIQ
jgi:hypothetical protein